MKVTYPVCPESILGILPTPNILGTGERPKYEFHSRVDVFEA